MGRIINSKYRARIKNQEVRKHLSNLLALLKYANNTEYGRWAWQSSDPSIDGVYGATQKAISKILVEVVPNRHGETPEQTVEAVWGEFCQIVTTFSIEELDESIERVLMGY